MKELLSCIDFGNEAGDDVDPQELKNYFVEQGTFAKFLDPKRKILLATAKKGVGKSALIKWIAINLEEAKAPDSLVISCKGNDLVRSNFHLTSQLGSPNEYIRDWMVRICSMINRAIGKYLQVALTDDHMSLVEGAEIDGFKEKNVLSALVARFPKILDKAAPKRTRPANEVEILKRLERGTVWFLVDDLDATYQRTDKENLELSTFFSACRQLTQLGGVIFRVTMRTDVWPSIRRFDESLDKVEQYVSDITWSQKDFRSLLFKRIEYQLELHGLQKPKLSSYLDEAQKQERFIDLVFEKRMAWGDYEKLTYRVIYTVSYHRPRWAIQLCKLARDEAVTRGAELIQKSDIDEVWGPYGKKRIADLISEHKHQCPEVEELILAFRGAERRLDRATLLKWITNRILNHVTPRIDGQLVRKPLPVAHFLFRMGFIVARTRDEEDWEHYYFSDMPDFLSGRTNDDFSVIWEIHPCYREALDIRKLNAFQRKNRNLAR